MTLLLILITAGVTVFLGFISSVQLLYLESLRLRARELPALVYFRSSLEQRIGLSCEQGALSFSIVKHGTLVILGLLMSLLTVYSHGFTPLAVAEAGGFSLLLMLIGAYFGPQLLYRRTSAHWLAPLAPLIKALAIIVRPVTAIFSFLETLASLGDKENGEEENGSSTEEDLEALIEAGADEGLIEEDDRQLIHSVVALGDKTARQVMTPRASVAAIEQSTTIEDFRKLALERHFSRFPVYGDSIDNILGIVHVRDILELTDEERSQHTVKEFVHPTIVVPETKPLADLFREMQRKHIHLAIVIDEYGETAGIATMEDVVEEVFGEIEDEYDPGAAVAEEQEGVFRISGKVDLDHLHELVDFRPDEETESTTVGGLVTEWLGRVPEVGAVVEQDGIRIEVTDADERHVEQVRVSRANNQSDDKE